MVTRNLIGIINQLTIFGQIEFINNGEYQVDINKDEITVTGKFKVVYSDDIEQLQIVLTKDQYINHSKP